MAAAAVGLLLDAEEERLRAHLDTCDDCLTSWTEQMKALTGEGMEADPDGEQHLPAAMIARWELAAKSLRGRERDAVQNHLMRCADCRADLVALGHRSELTERHPGPRLVRSRRSFGAGMIWGAGITALAAVIAGLVIMPTDTGPSSALLPWVAPVTMRGGNFATLDLAVGTREFTVLASVPTDLDPQRTARITVYGPGGAELISASVTAAMQTTRAVTIVIRDGRGVAGGDYRVVFSQSTTAGADLVRESSFRVNLSDSD